LYKLVGKLAFKMFQNLAFKLFQILQNLLETLPVKCFQLYKIVRNFALTFFNIKRSAQTMFFPCFVRFLEQTFIISLYTVNWLVFVA
jgi:hypothetical protein